MNRLKFSAAMLLALGALAPATLSANDPFEELDLSTSSVASPSAPAGDEFEAFKTQHLDEFDTYQRQLLEEFEAYKKIAAEENQRYLARVGDVWDAPELSSNKVWVDYSADFQTRNRVDFEAGTISISNTMENGESLDKDKLRQQLKALLAKNQEQAFKDDELAQAIEKRSKEELTLVESAEVKPTPILMPLVTDNDKPEVREFEQVIDQLLEKQVKTETSNSKGQPVVTVEVPFNEPVAQPVTARKMADARVNGLPKAARGLAGDVKRFADHSKLDPTLVFAIIETESAFNPMAKSPVPAYGLMQIVPESAGMDATAQLFGQGRILAPSYLYATEKNIEVGATYLNILFYRYLKDITDPQSRLYCAIAAYNTGHGNVAKAFVGNTKFSRALPKINALKPEEVYNHLFNNLPYEETRKYLEKVVGRMPKYAA